MIAAGMNVIFHVRELAVMGFLEVLRHLPLLRAVERTILAVVRGKRPDLVLLIDYPGFNLRLARKIRELAPELRTKIAYYISPQVWAWNMGRVKKMKGLIDRMLVILPFEEKIYTDAGIECEFVGHPLLEVLTEPQAHGAFCKRYDLDPARPILGIFPGSRKQEIERIFPAMLGAARVLAERHGVQPVVGVSAVLDFDFMRGFLREGSPVRLLRNATHDIMHNSAVAIVTSGTATLETGFFGTPMVVVYKTSWPTYLIGRLLVRVKNIGLVNIVAGRRIVPELIQGDVTPARIADAAGKFILDPGLRDATAAELKVIPERLGTPGASSRVAEALLGMV